MPKVSLLETMREIKIAFHISNYGELCRGKQKIAEFTAIAQKYNIPVSVETQTNWYDFGYSLEWNGVKPEDMEDFFWSCDQRKFCTSMKKGKMVVCCRGIRTAAVKNQALPENDSFDLTDFHPHRKRELIEFLLGYSETGYPSYCRFCKGGPEEKRACIPAGEQL